MGILDELKKAIFGAKSVAKSKSHQAAESVSETVDHTIDKTMEGLDDLSERSKKILDDIKNNETVDKVTNSVSEAVDAGVNETQEAIDKLQGATEAIGANVIKTSADILDKARNVGEDLFDKSSDIVGSAKEHFEKGGSEIVEKAKDIGEDLKSKFDDTFAKAQAAAAKAHKNKDIPYESSEKAKETLSNTSFPDSSDDFWDKAEAYAEGRYDDVRETGDIRVLPESAASDSDPKQFKAPGFEDHDGDGDEIIDDAIIVDPES